MDWCYQVCYCARLAVWLALGKGKGTAVQSFNVKRCGTRIRFTCFNGEMLPLLGRFDLATSVLQGCKSLAAVKQAIYDASRVPAFSHGHRAQSTDIDSDGLGLGCI